eukprot:3703171-Rhodomonas_salina.1
MLLPLPLPLPLPLLPRLSLGARCLRAPPPMLQLNAQEPEDCWGVTMCGPRGGGRGGQAVDMSITDA